MFKDQLSRNVIEIFILFIFEWPFYTGFTVPTFLNNVTDSMLAPFVC